MIALIICVISVASGILAWLSFTKPLEKGSWDDADFFSLYQGALTQVSGIAIITTTFFRNAHVAKQAWRCAWALSILGLISSIVAVPFYGIVPNRIQYIAGCCKQYCADLDYIDADVHRVWMTVSLDKHVTNNVKGVAIQCSLARPRFWRLFSLHKQVRESLRWHS